MPQYMHIIRCMAFLGFFYPISDELAFFFIFAEHELTHGVSHFHME